MMCGPENFCVEEATYILLLLPKDLPSQAAMYLGRGGILTVEVTRVSLSPG